MRLYQPMFRRSFMTKVEDCALIVLRALKGKRTSHRVLACI